MKRRGSDKYAPLKWVSIIFAVIGPAWAVSIYLHGTFVTKETFNEHKARPHEKAVTATGYAEDVQDMKQRVDRVEKKVDKMMDLLIELRAEKK